MPAPVDVGDDLLAERAALLDLLRGLDAAAWAAPTECPAWTVHGVALHVLGDDLSLLSRQRDAATNGLLLYAEDHPGLDFRALLDGFNEAWVAGARFLSPALTIELLELSGRWSHDYYATVDPGLLSEPVFFFGATGPSPIWQAAAREYVERWIHQHQIRRAVGAPDLGPPFLRTAVTVGLRGTAVHLGGDGAAADAGAGTSLVIVIDDVGTWTLTRSADGWTASDCLDGDPTSDPADDPRPLRFTAPQAVRLLSSGIGPFELLGQLTEALRTH